MMATAVSYAGRRLCVATALLLTVVTPAFAQQVAAPADTAGAFADPGAAALLEQARQRRFSTDSLLRSYTALVRTRMAASVRTPIRSRTLVTQETAGRVRWSRDAETVVQLLAGRIDSPGGVELPTGLGVRLFDPSSDRMFFGLGRRRSAQQDSAGAPSANETGTWIEHPLGKRAEQLYRFASGDTITLRLQNGREVRAVELRVTPRREDFHTVRGLLWIDASSGALVQAAFRLSRPGRMVLATGDGSVSLGPADAGLPGKDQTGKLPGFLKPMQYDVSLVTLEYSLWDFRYWLPRTARFQGLMRMGSVDVPASLEISYDIEKVETDEDGRASQEEEVASRTAEEWAAQGYHRVVRPARDSSRAAVRDSVLGPRPVVLTPNDSTQLLTSSLLPRPMGEDDPEFLGQDEIKRMADAVQRMAVPFHRDVSSRLGWGFGEPGMVRYNRVEALSVGVRYSMSLPFAIATATARIATGDWHPEGELLLQRSTVRRTLELRGYHELATVDASRKALGFANSMSALLFGRDQGEYYRATGAAFTWAPSFDARRWWELTGYVEDQKSVERNTRFALPGLWSDHVFRENIVADDALQYGGLVRFRPSWGSDAGAFHAGMDILAQAEAGDYRHVRGTVSARAVSPLGRSLLLGAEVGAGTSTGDVPTQRLFYLGGASTLRGYEPSTVGGTSMLRARLELAARTPVLRPTLFADWGWAGDRKHWSRADQRLSVGLGASLLDGMVRLDLARAIKAPRGWRLELYLDGIM